MTFCRILYFLGLFAHNTPYRPVTAWNFRPLKNANALTHHNFFHNRSILDDATISPKSWFSGSSSRLPHRPPVLNRDLADSETNHLSLTEKFPHLREDVIQSLVNEGKFRAEELFGFPLDSENDDAQGFSKRQLFRNSPSRFPTVNSVSPAARLGRFGSVADRILPVSQRANVLLDVLRGVTTR